MQWLKTGIHFLVKREEFRKTLINIIDVNLLILLNPTISQFQTGKSVDLLICSEAYLFLFFQVETI